MAHAIGIRRETSSPRDRRAPVTPALARRLAENGDLAVVVQPSARRLYHDKEYVRAGATLASDLSETTLILGIGAPPAAALEPGKVYASFARLPGAEHPDPTLLTQLLQRGSTLVDYEQIIDDHGRRLFSIDRLTGISGLVDALWALGQRLSWEGVRSPLAALQPAHTAADLAELKAALRAVGRRIAAAGLPPAASPVVIGIAGSGGAARGVREILAELPIRDALPEQIDDVCAASTAHRLVQVAFRERDTVAPIHAGEQLSLEDYRLHPERYRSSFAPYLPMLTVLLRCDDWQPGFPRLVTRDDLRRVYSTAETPRLRVIADLACRLEGGIECIARISDPGDPVSVWHPDTGVTSSGVAGPGPVVLAVDGLSAELPGEVSEELSSALGPILPAMARADWAVDLERLAVPESVRRGVVVHHGRLSPRFAHLARGLSS